MNKAIKIIEEIKRLNEVATYEVVYYEKVGEHGSAGGHPTFDRAFVAAKKVEVDEGTWYVGVEGPDRFAVIHITQEYIDHNKPSYFDSEKTYQKWVTVAKKALETKEPQEGKW